MNNAQHHVQSIINRQRRQIQVRRNILTLILSLFTVAIASISFISLSTEANDMEHQPSYKYYKSVQISRGDTLWSIANDNFDAKYYKNKNEYITEIKKMNSLTSNDIVAGSYIIVPYYSSKIVDD